MSITKIINEDRFKKEINSLNIDNNLIRSIAKTKGSFFGKNSIYLIPRKDRDFINITESKMGDYYSVVGKLFHTYAILRIIKEANYKSENFTEFLNNRFMVFPDIDIESNDHKIILNNHNKILMFLKNEISLEKDNSSFKEFIKSVLFFNELKDFSFKAKTAKTDSIKNFFNRFEKIFKEINFEEVTQLAKHFDKFFIKDLKIKNAKYIKIAPRFGSYSYYIGAEADLFIDGTLFDFKTTFKHVTAREDFLQTYLYFVLDSMYKNSEETSDDSIYKTKNISKISIYYARSGSFVDINIKDIPNEKNIREKLIYLLEKEYEQKYLEDKKIYKNCTKNERYVKYNYLPNNLPKELIESGLILKDQLIFENCLFSKINSKMRDKEIIEIINLCKLRNKSEVQINIFDLKDSKENILKKSESESPEKNKSSDDLIRELGFKIFSLSNEIKELKGKLIEAEKICYNLEDYVNKICKSKEYN